MSVLRQQHCTSPNQGLMPMVAAEIGDYVKQLNGWETDDAQKSIHKTFNFDDFYQTMSFVNAVAWIANNEDHHPDLEVSYKRCRVIYTTHAVEGLSMNDFICAAKIDALGP